MFIWDVGWIDNNLEQSMKTMEERVRERGKRKGMRERIREESRWRKNMRITEGGKFEGMFKSSNLPK